MSFTPHHYSLLLTALKNSGYSFQSFEQYISSPLKKTVILRHDVDRLPANALVIARLENAMGIPASYYFRMVPVSFDKQIILQVAALGHEIGYHYETMDTASRKSQIPNHESQIPNHKSQIRNQKSEFLPDLAYDEFCQNLQIFRNLVPIITICMHGSPLSRYDNREIWKKYDYKSLGIIAEPYFDVDYSKVFYITDTGRKWNNESSNVRDLVNRSFNIPIKSTSHLISLIHNGLLPDQVMINTHPQRWFPYGFSWLRELVFQNLKNILKRILLFLRRSGK